MRISIKLILSVCLLLSTFSPFAQAANGVSMRFASLIWSTKEGGKNAEFDQLFFRSGGSYEKLKAEVGRPGDSQQYSGSRKMTLYKEGMKKGQMVYIPVAQVLLPANPKRVLLFVSHDKTITAMAVNISGRSLPKGAILFLNLSGADCVAMIQEKPGKVLESQSKIFKTVPNAKFEVPIKVAVHDAKKKKWKKAYSIVTRMVQTKSYIVVFYLANGRKNAYRLKIMRDLNLIE